MNFILALVVAQVGVDSRQITEGSKASFTVAATYEPGAQAALAYFTEDDAPFEVPSGTPATRESAAAARQDVGRIYRANVRVFLLTDPAQKALYENAKAKIPEILKSRKAKIAELQAATLLVLAADDAALAELAKGRKSAAAIVEKGAAAAEEEALAAMKSAWEKAEAKWKAAANAISKWKTLREEIKALDDALNAALGLGAWPDPCAESDGGATVESDATKLAVSVKIGAPWVTAVEIRFLADEYATSVGKAAFVREIALVRPDCSWKLVRAASGEPEQVSVTRLNGADRLKIGADLGWLGFAGGAAPSSGPHAVSISLYADAETKAAASLPGANVGYTFDGIYRTPDADVEKKKFCYDDPRSKALDRCLVLYVRGSLVPAIGRYAAFDYLRNLTHFEITALEDSHAEQPKFVRLLWRRSHPTDRKKGAIEFALRLKKAHSKETSVKVADYSPEEGGRFLFSFAYQGLPSVNSEFGQEKTLTMHLSDGTVVGTPRKFVPFFNLEKSTHPIADSIEGDSRTRADGLPNYLYYYSEDARGTKAAAVAGLRFASTPVNGRTVAVFAGGEHGTRPGTMGLTNEVSYGYKVTFYSTKLLKLWRSEDDGLRYSFDEERDLEFYNPNPNNGDGKWTTERRRLTVSVHKRFVHLVAHVWRHELRHVEQYEGLAGSGRDEDHDRVAETAESANNTSPNSKESWPRFPISQGSTEGDNEVDCELRAAAVTGATASDWGVVFDGDQKPGKGSQWED